MSLRRFTDGRIVVRWRSIAVLLAIGLAYGCAGNGPPDRGSGAAGNEAERIVPARAQTLYEQAVAAMAAGDHTDAELRFSEFLLQYPGYPGAHVNLAIIHAQDGNDSGAAAAISQALTLNAVYAPALNQLGMLRRRQGRFEDAEVAYLRAVDADPEYALAHYNLGVLNELYLQRLEPALQHFEIYQSLSAEDEQVSKWIADLKRRIGANQRTANVTE